MLHPNLIKSKKTKFSSGGMIFNAYFFKISLIYDVVRLFFWWFRMLDFYITFHLSPTPAHICSQRLPTSDAVSFAQMRCTSWWAFPRTCVPSSPCTQGLSRDVLLVPITSAGPEMLSAMSAKLLLNNGFTIGGVTILHCSLCRTVPWEGGRCRIAFAKRFGIQSIWIQLTQLHRAVIFRKKCGYCPHTTVLTVYYYIWYIIILPYIQYQGNGFHL